MIIGPDTKYKMMWGGEWRAVMNIYAAGTPTTLALRATSAVLYINPEEFVATAVAPGDLIERTDRIPDAREWDYIGH